MDKPPEGVRKSTNVPGKSKRISGIIIYKYLSLIPVNLQVQIVKTQHLRKDKTCLNCGYEVPERFCSHCGQENVETKESFGHLVGHFFADITHYDSKFLLTLKYLFTRPGYLTQRYVMGHRMDYVNPIRLYVFTSFIFFLLLGAIVMEEHDPYVRTTFREGGHEVVMVEGKVHHAMDSSIHALQDSITKTDSKQKIETYEATIKDLEIGKLAASHDPDSLSIQKYDSILQTMPPKYRHGFFKRKIMIRYLNMRAKYGERVQEVIAEKIKHHYPKLMFLLLPFFALLLSWIFRRKDLYYADHAIFSIHVHTFIFLSTTVIMLINWGLHWDNIYWYLMLVFFIYFVLAAKRMYSKGWMKTIWRCLFTLLMYGFGTLIVLLLFFMIILVFA